MTSHRPITPSYSPQFSNATPDHAAPVEVSTTPAAEQRKSEPNGDHHLLFVDLADAVGHPHRNEGGTDRPEKRRSS